MSGGNPGSLAVALRGTAVGFMRPDPGQEHLDSGPHVFCMKGQHARFILAHLFKYPKTGGYLSDYGLVCPVFPC